MPKMDGTGPGGKGSGTGRGMGCCKKDPENKDLTGPGKRSGKRRQSGGGRGQGNRLKSGPQK